MIRGALIGTTALVSSVGAFLYNAGSWQPEILVGAPSSGGGNLSGGTQGSRTITGDAVDTWYGAVQVEITVTGTHIDSVSVVKAPTGRNQQFTDFAIPTLVQETLDAQSAKISSVSGASHTSEGFIKSLQSAIAKI